ncbi:DinB family protein [Nocardia sp. NPDC052566]|uniref:DinB family protein n=1 Tax=Nocardia sp. NPDC052566 TaxID=3364330 RepID=UPI0037C79C12
MMMAAQRQRIRTGSERVLIESMLADNRTALIDAVSGLSEQDARRRLVPSLTTPIGLIKHAAAAERFWFQHFLAGLDESDCDGPATPGDPSFTVADDETVDDVIAEFERASRRSDEIAADYNLEYIKHHPQAGPVTVRFILLHAIEEFARHAGHADILREQIESTRSFTDGSTTDHRGDE